MIVEYMAGRHSLNILLAVLAFCLRTNAGEVRYTVRNLVPVSTPVNISGGIGINRHGDVAGSYWTEGFPTRSRLFLYSGSGQLQDVGYPAGGSAIPSAINDFGQVALRANGPSGDSHLFRWSAETGFEDLGTLPESSVSEVGGINNFGEILGSADRSNRIDIIFRYTDEAGIEPLGGPPGVGGGAWGINDEGWITGSRNGWNAFLYRPGLGFTNIGVGVGRSVSDKGTIAGTAGAQVGSLGAFIHRNGTNKLLGTLGGLNSDAYGINEFDVVVGCAELLPWFPTPVSGFLWTDREGMLDLNSLIDTNSGWTINEARAINDSGQITGWGYFAGKTRAYRLDPIPPRMSTYRSETNVAVSWSPAWPGIVLESSLTLSPPEWQPISTNGTNSLSLPLSGPSRFFRLNLDALRGLCCAPE